MEGLVFNSCWQTCNCLSFAQRKDSLNSSLKTQRKTLWPRVPKWRVLPLKKCPLKIYWIEKQQKPLRESSYQIQFISDINDNSTGRKKKANKKSKAYASKTPPSFLSCQFRQKYPELCLQFPGMPFRANQSGERTIPTTITNFYGPSCY